MSAPGRRVERPVRLRRDAAPLRKQAEQAGFHGDGRGEGGAVEPADFAVIAVDGELIFEIVEEIEGGFAVSKGGVAVERQDDFKGRGHGAARQTQKGRVGWRRQRRAATRFEGAEDGRRQRTLHDAAEGNRGGS